MKKTISIFLVVLLLFVGCSTRNADDKWKPQHVSGNIKAYTEKALDLVDQYLAFEISLKEFSAGIEEVHSRLDWDDCEEDNSADTAVCTTISDLYFHYDEFDNNTFRMYRDILCFQLGMSTSGETYLPQKNIQTYESKGDHLVDLLKLQAFPASDISVYIFEDSQLPHVWMTFDMVNRVMPEDVFTHYKTLIKKVQMEAVRINSLMISYCIYGQSVFAIDVSLDDSGEYTLCLDLEVGAIHEREYVKPTDENIERMVNAASAYVSDYVK